MLRTLTSFICLTLVLATSSSVAAASKEVRANNKRPNIIIILADDMGYSDPGFMGSEIETPNLDKLASEGTVFTRFMTHGKCEPSRASLMTGVHFHRQTHDHVTRKFNNVSTIAAELKKAGYFTASTGKWHLPEQPTDHGFDRFFGLVQGAANHFDPSGQLKLPPECYLHSAYALNGESFTVEDENFYSTDAYTDYALEFLNERPKDAPFFLYLAYTAPHWPLQAPEETIKKYAGRYTNGWEQLREDRHKGLIERGMIPDTWLRAQPDSQVKAWNQLSKSQQSDKAHSMAVHAAMLDRLDQQVGRVLQQLRESGELENTLILFSSDNGVSAETRFDRTPKKPAGPADSFRTLPLGFCNAVNAPYRRYKSSNANGGICSPLIAYWPGKIPEGRIETLPINILDIMPTLLEVAGSEYPKDLQPLDRQSILSKLAGDSTEPAPMFFQLQYSKSVNQKAVIQWPWKAWFDKDNGWSLYQLDQDGAETIDLSTIYPEKQSHLIKLYEQFDQQALANTAK